MSHRWRLVGRPASCAAATAWRALVLAAVALGAWGAGATPARAANGHAAPRTAAANDAWWGALAQPGTDAMVSALTLFDGKLVLSGSFGRAGGVAVNRVVQWDGGGWRKLGTGLSESAPAGCIYNGELIVGGARWDGSAWQPLGPGIHGVSALIPFGADLIAGGTFTQVGSTGASHIARWNGVAWQPLGLGVDATVRALAVYGGELIAAGDFLTAGGVAAAHIARWNGTQWQPLGAGTSSAIYALLVHGADLVAGGGFGYAGGAPASRVARWDGAHWSALGAGRPASVLALGEYQGNLVCGGNGVDVATWNGTSWVSFPVPLLGVRCLREFAGQLVAGGTFAAANGIELDNLARWDGSTWRPLHALGIAGPGGTPALAVHAFTVWNGEWIAAGEFTHAGGVTCTRVAAFDGTTWRPLGAGLDGTVEALVVHQGSLYAGGSFTHSGAESVPCVARWDGTTWGAVGTGVNAPVHALLSWGGELVAAGEFVVAGDADANHIAQWDGGTWHAFDLGMDSSVHALAVYRDSVVAGGDFNWASGNPVNGIARWDGSEWQPLGIGLNVVNALAVYGDEVVAGGQFSTIGSTTPAHGMARWDGRAWRPLDPSAGGAVYALAVHGPHLYVGGALDVGGTAAGGVLRWNGAAWDSLGTGLGTYSGARDGVAAALCVDGPRLWVGGRFLLAGRKAAGNIARWTLDTTPVLVEDFQIAAAADGVHLTWSLAPDAPATLAGVWVQRASAAAGPFTDCGSVPLAPAVHMRFDDARVEPGRTYWYRVRLVTEAGTSFPAPPVRITTFAGAVSTALLGAQQPRAGGPVVVRFTLGSDAPYRLAIYDVRGRQVRTLAAGQGVAGENVRHWDLRDDTERTAGRGIYFMRLEAGGVTSTRKFALLHR
jgi:hypothetical protein